MVKSQQMMKIFQGENQGTGYYQFMGKAEFKGPRPPPTSVFGQNSAVSADCQVDRVPPPWLRGGGTSLFCPCNDLSWMLCPLFCIQRSQMLFFKMWSHCHNMDKFLILSMQWGCLLIFINFYRTSYPTLFSVGCIVTNRMDKLFVHPGSVLSIWTKQSESTVCPSWFCSKYFKTGWTYSSSTLLTSWNYIFEGWSNNSSMLWQWLHI